MIHLARLQTPWRFVPAASRLSAEEVDRIASEAPFCTTKGLLRNNCFASVPVGLSQRELELPGANDDRPWVTYYVPTEHDIAVAAELFPGQGMCPPWPTVFGRLLSYLPRREVIQLKCYEGLTELNPKFRCLM